MTEQLKTQEKIYDELFDKYTVNDRLVALNSFNRERQEAIKWIKHGINHPLYAEKKDFTIRTLAVNTWIKHFFNITEEELK